VRLGKGAGKMKFEFFSVPACSPEQGQQELNAFCGTHRIVSIEKQFVPNGEQNYYKKVIGEKVAPQLLRRIKKSKNS
jgi:hypothetical protein